MSANHEIDVPEHHLFEQPLQHCPSCGSTDLHPVVEDGTVSFFCEQCARCWHYELGSVWRVDPNTCAHCEHYERCARVHAADYAPPSGGAVQ